MAKPATETALLNLTRISVGVAVALNLAMVFIRSLDGLPQGVDSTSHLFRIMLMSKTYRENGYIPQWNPDWYGGANLFLLYPPLSYYLAFVVSLAGLDPVSAYKLVDSLFLLFGPVTVYYLARCLQVDRREALLAASFMSVSPAVVENYIFYDRYPSIVSFPFVCLFMVALFRALEGKRKALFLACSGALFGVIVLTHHLSALCAALFGLLLALKKGLDEREPFCVARSLIVTIASFLMGASLSSFWLFPFIAASGQLLGNPFYNRNVEFPFIRLSYFSVNVVTYAFGVAHTGLALFALWRCSLVLGLDKRFVPSTILTMLSGMMLFEVGEKSAGTPVKVLGQSIVVLSLLSLCYAVLRSGRSTQRAGTRTDLTLMWFVAFFWLSLGSYALPPVALAPLSSVWRALDVHRFWLYLSVPLSMLAAIGLRQLTEVSAKLFARRHWHIPAALVMIILLGGCVKVAYTLANDVSEFLPYPVTNKSIPAELITYFRADPTYARILAIRCPFWIYVLPYYTGKPLIDGWYPQDKLLKHLLEIDDYRILDLESAGSVKPESPNRTRIWRDLILRSKVFAIKWVVVGKVDEEVRLSLFDGTDFEYDASIAYEDGAIMVYRCSEPVSMAEAASPFAGEVAVSRDSADVLRLTLDGGWDGLLVVREAYFPTWRAVSAGVSLDIEKDPEGFIMIRVPSGVKEITLYHKPIDPSAYYLSVATTAALLLVIGHELSKRRTLKDGCKQ